MANRSLENFILLRRLFILIALGLGAIECWFTRYDYTTDAISYLNVLNGIRVGDWKLALNPQWSIGYPFLIYCIEHLFPATPYGEWQAIHVLNLLVYTGSLFAFLFLLSSLDFQKEGFSAEDTDVRSFIFVAAMCIFLCTELCIDAASRVGPDTMISTLFLLALALTIRLSRSMKKSEAVLLGAVMGFGYLFKAIFLPLSAILLLVLVCASWRKKKVVQVLAAAVLTLAVIGVPYIQALSWSYGRFTWGESGALNYAFHVNHLPHWTNWQGGPSGYGAPIHPTRKLIDVPLVFEFAEPFHTTYPPFNNLAYWYEGYRHFWNLKLQLVAIARNLYYLGKVLVVLPIMYGIGICLILLFLFLKDKRAWKSSLYKTWIAFVPAMLGIALYAMVHLEGRYVSSFILILAVLPFVTLNQSIMALSSKQRWIVLAILMGTAAGTIATGNRLAFASAIHGPAYKDTPEWRLGEYLKHAGLKPGDRIAAISEAIPNANCTWAYMDRLRIVAEIGSNAYLPGRDDLNEQAFWNATPEVRAKVLDLFRKAGAVAVIVTDKPKENTDPGWVQAAHTYYWVYRL